LEIVYGIGKGWLTINKASLGKFGGKLWCCVPQGILSLKRGDEV